MYTQSPLLYPFGSLSSKYLFKEVQYRVSQKFAPLISWAKTFDKTYVNIKMNVQITGKSAWSIREKPQLVVVVFTYKQFMT